jgi:hypothetical protein
MVLYLFALEDRVKLCAVGNFSNQEAFESDDPSGFVGILLDFDDLKIYNKMIANLLLFHIPTVFSMSQIFQDILKCATKL